MDVFTHFIEERCPKCGARLLTDGVRNFCSYVGAGEYYPPCDYGIKELVYVDSESK